MPVAGRCATSSAITTAVPRRNPYGDAIIRPTRIGTSRPTRPSCESMICCTGSGRPTGTDQSAQRLARHTFAQPFAQRVALGAVDGAFAQRRVGGAVGVGEHGVGGRGSRPGMLVGIPRCPFPGTAFVPRVTPPTRSATPERSTPCPSTPPSSTPTDVDWTLPEYADRHAEYTAFGEAAAAVHPRRRGAVPDHHRHHRPRARRQGRRRGHHRRPVRRDQGGAHRLLPAGVRRPRRGDRGRRARSPAPGTAPSRSVRSSISAGEPRAIPPRGRPRRPRPPGARRGPARAGHARRGSPATCTLAEDAVQDAAVRALETWPRDGVPAEPRAWLTPPPAAARSTSSAARRRAPARRPRLRVIDRTTPRPAGDQVATTCCGWCSPAATRRCRSSPGGAGLRTLCGLSTAEVGAGAAGARGDDGQAAHPGPAEDRQARDPVPGARRPRAARPAARRAGRRLPAVQRPGTRPDRATPRPDAASTRRCG